MRGQWVIRRQRQYIVVTHIGRRHVVDGKRWEVEHTNGRGRTRLHYRTTLRGTVRLVRHLLRAAKARGGR